MTRSSETCSTAQQRPKGNIGSLATAFTMPKLLAEWFCWSNQIPRSGRCYLECGDLEEPSLPGNLTRPWNLSGYPRLTL